MVSSTSAVNASYNIGSLIYWLLVTTHFFSYQMIMLVRDLYQPIIIDHVKMVVIDAYISQCL